MASNGNNPMQPVYWPNQVQYPSNPYNGMVNDNMGGSLSHLPQQPVGNSPFPNYSASSMHGSYEDNKGRQLMEDRYARDITAVGPPRNYTSSPFPNDGWQANVPEFLPGQNPMLPPSTTSPPMYGMQGQYGTSMSSPLYPYPMPMHRGMGGIPGGPMGMAGNLAAPANLDPMLMMLQPPHSHATAPHPLSLGQPPMASAATTSHLTLSQLQQQQAAAAAAASAANAQLSQAQAAAMAAHLNHSQASSQLNHAQMTQVAAGTAATIPGTAESASASALRSLDIFNFENDLNDLSAMDFHSGSMPQSENETSLCSFEERGGIESCNSLSSSEMPAYLAALEDGQHAGSLDSVSSRRSKSSLSSAKKRVGRPCKYQRPDNEDDPQWQEFRKGLNKHAQRRFRQRQKDMLGFLKDLHVQQQQQLSDLQNSIQTAAQQNQDLESQIVMLQKQLMVQATGQSGGPNEGGGGERQEKGERKGESKETHGENNNNNGESKENDGENKKNEEEKEIHYDDKAGIDHANSSHQIVVATALNAEGEASRASRRGGRMSHTGEVDPHSVASDSQKAAGDNAMTNSGVRHQHSSSNNNNNSISNNGGFNSAGTAVSRSSTPTLHPALVGILNANGMMTNGANGVTNYSSNNSNVGSSNANIANASMNICTTAPLSQPSISSNAYLTPSPQNSSSSIRGGGGAGGGGDRSRGVNSNSYTGAVRGSNASSLELMALSAIHNLNSNTIGSNNDNSNSSNCSSNNSNSNSNNSSIINSITSTAANNMAVAARQQQQHQQQQAMSGGAEGGVAEIMSHHGVISHNGMTNHRSASNPSLAGGGAENLSNTHNGLTNYSNCHVTNTLASASKALLSTSAAVTATSAAAAAAGFSGPGSGSLPPDVTTAPFVVQQQIPIMIQQQQQILMHQQQQQQRMHQMQLQLQQMNRMKDSSNQSSAPSMGNNGISNHSNRQDAKES
uniref:BZIP domain-containing protein n=1 Tax=Polytomella parva TaxID=51329 RepID=A0A7S0VD78_9CHLO|mmetsp:Transcript_4249/g.7576  ORF Transcript_4249/g.7576 Transcript_4249/m.7576 type:complete len:959 (+) Transcript_4249:134-3010(+)|eukprot:CAMPEP_0175080656 /NCGR_PEP_ID=MMETSP0052_2-20121109/25645_1 /TAXON_ID=51329 ORGANISM="Polytomella parva, Strain SAG 63-3" /NCGR_SAMPLE_ID=MMETSP0052_2 /ASSEMBLY_ACC=CAM_ASM_000194 /LENGTH=958 /DNA_ID=CAMNT_0016351413 /DNA_START=82 /DNA_END=2958 /DNA_ORIENTATION=+